MLITGKGRCNITNDADISEFITNVPCNGRFLYSSFSNYSNKDIIEFLNKQGVKTKVERGKRIFPVSDKSIDVLNAFEKRLKELNVKILREYKVEDIEAKNGEIVGVEIKNLASNRNQKIFANKVVIATGGMSYPGTGSTGDGYKFAEKFGHKVIKAKPSLVPLNVYYESLWFCKEAQGVSLKNVKIIVKDGDKNIFEDFGEMLFTHLGVSGPIILSSSAYLLRWKNIEEKLKARNIKIYIDLKPALDEEKLDLRIRRDFEESKNKSFKNSLDRLLPQKLIAGIVKLSNINPEKKVNEITKEERIKLVKLLKGISLEIEGFGSIYEAIITSGGIDVKEINPKTMESKIIKGLYFAGEIIDVDALTGGFNLQIAYSTGYTSGQNTAK